MKDKDLIIKMIKQKEKLMLLIELLDREYELLIKNRSIELLKNQKRITKVLEELEKEKKTIKELINSIKLDDKKYELIKTLESLERKCWIKALRNKLLVEELKRGNEEILEVFKRNFDMAKGKVFSKLL